MVMQAPATTPPWQALEAWYRTPLGEQCRCAIGEVLQASLGKCFGYHLLQLGLSSVRHWLDESPIEHRIFFCDEAGGASVRGDFTLLPFAENSLDAIILPHTLSFVSDPDRVLQEVARVLRAEGRAFIIDFNAYSLWGLARCWRQFTHEIPWRYSFRPYYTIRRRVHAADLSIIESQTFFYRPPSKQPSRLQQLLFLETLGRLIYPYPGGLYLLTVSKRIIPVTPVKPLWQQEATPLTGETSRNRGIST